MTRAPAGYWRCYGLQVVAHAHRSRRLSGKGSSRGAGQPGSFVSAAGSGCPVVKWCQSGKGSGGCSGSGSRPGPARGTRRAPGRCRVRRHVRDPWAGQGPGRRPWPGCGPASGVVPSPAARSGSTVLTVRSSPAGCPCWPRLVARRSRVSAGGASGRAGPGWRCRWCRRRPRPGGGLPRCPASGCCSPGTGTCRRGAGASAAGPS